MINKEVLPENTQIFLLEVMFSQKNVENPFKIIKILMNNLSNFEIVDPKILNLSLKNFKYFLFNFLQKTAKNHPFAKEFIQILENFSKITSFSIERIINFPQNFAATEHENLLNSIEILTIFSRNSFKKVNKIILKILEDSFEKSDKNKIFLLNILNFLAEKLKFYCKKNYEKKLNHLIFFHVKLLFTSAENFHKSLENLLKIYGEKSLSKIIFSLTSLNLQKKTLERNLKKTNFSFKFETIFQIESLNFLQSFTECFNFFQNLSEFFDFLTRKKKNSAIMESQEKLKEIKDFAKFFQISRPRQIKFLIKVGIFILRKIFNSQIFYKKLENTLKKSNENSQKILLTFAKFLNEIFNFSFCLTKIFEESKELKKQKNFEKNCLNSLNILKKEICNILPVEMFMEVCGIFIENYQFNFNGKWAILQELNIRIKKKGSFYGKSQEFNNAKNLVKTILIDFEQNSSIFNLF